MALDVGFHVEGFGLRVVDLSGSYLRLIGSYLRLIDGVVDLSGMPSPASAASTCCLEFRVY